MADEDVHDEDSFGQYVALRQLRQINRRLDRIENTILEAIVMALDNLLRESDELGQAVAEIGTATSDALAKIRSAIDDLRAQVAQDAIDQAAVDQVTAKLDDAAGTLASVADSITAAGNDPGSPVPAPEPTPEG